MSNQRCACGNDKFTELVITKTFDVLVEEDGFVDLSESRSEYPEPSYICQNKECGIQYVLEAGRLVRVVSEDAEVT